MAQEVATALLFQHQGYAVELADGLVLAAFAHPANAIAWSLKLVHAMPLQVGFGWGWVADIVKGCWYFSYISVNVKVSGHYQVDFGQFWEERHG